MSSKGSGGLERVTLAFLILGIPVSATSGILLLYILFARRPGIVRAYSVSEFILIATGATILLAGTILFASLPNLIRSWRRDR